MLIRIFNVRVLLFSIVLGVLCLGLTNNSFAGINGGNTYTYAGANNGSWNVKSNWSGGSDYPGFAVGDIAIINNNVNINFTGAPPNAIASITVNTGVTATITISSGVTLAVTGSITIGTGSASNLTITGPGSATVKGLTFGYQSTFTIGSSGVTTTGLTLNSGSTMSMNQNNNAFTNYGTFTAINSTLSLSGGPANFTNHGTVNLNTGSTMQVTNNTSNITNSGTLNINTSTITLAGGPNPFNSSGTVNLNSGSTFTVTNNNTFFTNTGTFNATSATISFSGTAGAGGINNTSPGVFTATSTTISMIAGSGNFLNNTGTFSATLCPITLGGGPTAINNTGGTFTANGCTITMAQSSNITNSATCTLQASGATVTTVNFGYGAYIANTGTFYAGTSNSQCILNVSSQTAYISNSGTGAAFKLGSTSIIYPTGYSASVTNTSPAVFTLQSDQYGSAAIGPMPSTVTGFVGTFNTERYYQGSGTYDNVKKRWLGRNYRIISSPVNTGTPVSGNYVYGLNYIAGITAGQTSAANSANNAFVTGAAGGSTSAGNPSIYLYNESIIPSNATFTSGNFIGITDITNSTTAGTIGASDGGTYSIPIGTGVFFFFRGAATNWGTRTASPYIAPDNVTLTSTGQINQGALTTKDWYNPSVANLSYTVTGVGTGSNTNTAVRGFNMVGNPYPCSIDWNTSFSSAGITLTNINPTIYVFNGVTNQYDTYITTSASTGTGTGNATNIIASGQGFFVQANATGAALTFTENAKAPTSQPTGGNLLMGVPIAQNATPMLRLKLGVDSLNYDDIAIGFNSTASTKYNFTEDARYLTGISAVVGLSSLSADGINLAINALPLPALNQQAIKLDVEALNSGTYTLKRTSLTAIPQIYDIWLMDKYKKDSLDIRKDTIYTFTINKADTTTFGTNRFSIVIRQNPALALHLLSFNATKASSESQIVWKTEYEQNYTNFTVERSNDNGTNFITLGGFLSTAQGAYSFTDKMPINGANQYRLKLVDLNGTVTYSNIVTLQYSNLSNSIVNNNISVYPNPSSSIINLAIIPNRNFSTDLSVLQTANLMPSLVVTPANSISYDIKIINITGAIVKTATSSSTNWQNNISNLAPGTYIIQVVNNNDHSLVGKETFIKL